MTSPPITLANGQELTLALAHTFINQATKPNARRIAPDKINSIATPKNVLFLGIFVNINYLLIYIITFGGAGENCTRVQGKDITIIDKRKIYLRFLLLTYQDNLSKQQTDLLRLIHPFGQQMIRRTLD